MKTRIITAVVGIAVLAVVLMMFHSFVFDLIVSCIALLAMHEAFTAFGFSKKDLYLYFPCVPFTLVVMFSHFESVRTAVLPVSFLMAFYFAICLIKNHNTLMSDKLGGYIFFSGVILLCFYSLVELKRTLPYEVYHEDAVFFVVLILCMAWGGDTAAYFTGRFLGKHKLAPQVSPHKTIEGAIGGILGSVILSILATVIYQVLANRLDMFTEGTLGYTAYILLAIMAVISSVLGIIGDLFASAIKRQCGIKDYGTIFPGHGGILDRFDSVIFIAPFVTSCVTTAFYAMRR